MEKIFKDQIKKFSEKQQIELLKKYKLTDCKKAEKDLTESYILLVITVVTKLSKRYSKEWFNTEEMELYLLEELVKCIPRLKSVSINAVSSYIYISLEKQALRCMLKNNIIRLHAKKTSDSAELKEAKSTRFYYDDLDDYSLLLKTKDTIFNEIYQNEINEIIDNFLTSLPADKRTAFCFSTGYKARCKLSYKEIAILNNKHLDTIYILINKLKTELRDILKSEMYFA